jgi:effector-binding domain-containing protein
MREKRFLIRGSMIAAAGIVALLAVAAVRSATGQEAPAPSAAEMKSIQSEVADAKPLSTWAVVQEFNGSLDKVDGYLATFMKELASQDLDASLETSDPSAILILYEDPGSKREVRLAVGLTVPSRLRVREPLKVERLRAERAVRHVHVGPYQQLGRVHAALASSVSRQSAAGGARRTGWPVVLRLLNDPRLVKPEAIKTEMIVPVEAPPRGGLAPAEVTAIQRSVRDARPLSIWLVSQSFEGSVTETGDFLRKFMREFEAQGLGASLGGPEVRPLAILHGNPDQQKSIKIEIGFQVRDRVQVRPPLSVRQFQSKRVAAYTHQGDYRELAGVYGQIEQAARKLAPAGAAGRDGGPHWPVALRLLTDPATVQSPEQIRTEMLVPLDPGQG